MTKKLSRASEWAKQVAELESDKPTWRWSSGSQKAVSARVERKIGTPLPELAIYCNGTTITLEADGVTNLAKWMLLYFEEKETE